MGNLVLTRVNSERVGKLSEKMLAVTKDFTDMEITVTSIAIAILMQKPDLGNVEVARLVKETSEFISLQLVGLDPTDKQSIN